MSTKFKYQTKVCTIPQSTPAGKYPFSITMDADNDYAKAVAVYEVASGGLTGHMMGLRQREGKTFQDPTIMADWLCSSAVPQDRRYKEFGESIPAKGKEMVIEIETINENNDADAVYHVVFQLVKED
jgi:hypothetical protein